MMAKSEAGGKMVEMENLAGTVRRAAFPHYTERAGTIFHLSGGDDDLRDNSVGDFLELLGLSPSSFFDLPMPPPPPPSPPETTLVLPAVSVPPASEASDWVSFPVTATSCSISTSYTEAAGTNDVDQPRSAVTTDAEASADDEEEKPKQTLVEGKKKKKGQTPQREPRFAFLTRSEVDHLDDGYRWRKYGQKPVKNSPFPRSYYRCTSARCGVKKRVERSSSDPTVVVTTYEGQHTHPCPVGLRRSGGGHSYTSAGASVGDGGVPSLMPPSGISTFSPLGASQHHLEQQQLPLYGGGLRPPLRFTFIRPVDGAGSGGFRGAQEGVGRSEPGRHPMPATGGSGGDVLVGDWALLQDFVPHGVVRNGVLE